MACGSLASSAHAPRRQVRQALGQTLHCWLLRGIRERKEGSVDVNAENSADDDQTVRQSARCGDSQATHSGKPRVAYPTIKRLLIHRSCAMILTNLLECHDIM